MVEYKECLICKIKVEWHFGEAWVGLKQYVSEYAVPGLTVLVFDGGFVMVNVLTVIHHQIIAILTSYFKMMTNQRQIQSQIPSWRFLSGLIMIEIFNLFQMKGTFLLALLAVYAAALPSQNPVIGIFTLPDDGDEPKAGVEYPPKLTANNYTYIAASYVKFIQMAGAQVVPIFAFSNASYFDQLLPKLNGVLFTGGGTDINIKNKWTSNADYVLKWAINENKKGRVFPVWGTCLGWELLAYLTSGYDSKVLSQVRGEGGVRNTLDIQDDGYVYSGISPNLRYNLQNGQGITYFNHVWAVSSSYYRTSDKLRSFWNILSTTKSPYNQQFISTAEGKELPIFGIQYHPEKNLYEWKVKADRSDSGAEIVQVISNKFVEKARQSPNRFASYDEFTSLVIYNYKVQFTTMSFTQIYLFKEVVTAPEEVNLTIQ